jgi:hypothetical protein
MEDIRSSAFLATFRLQCDIAWMLTLAVMAPVTHSLTHSQAEDWEHEDYHADDDLAQGEEDRCVRL